MRREANEGRETLGHELDLDKPARAFAVDLYKETALFPTEERFGLTSQIRRAAVSIPANVAEGAGRQSKKEFVRFLLTARGSSAELRVLLEIAREVGHVSETRFRECEKVVDRLSSMTSGLIRQLRSR